MSGVFRVPFVAPAPVQAPALGAFTLPSAEPPVVPSVQPPYSDRSIANHFVSQYNGRVVKYRKAKKLTKKDMEFLFKAGLAVGRARHQEEAA